MPKWVSERLKIREGLSIGGVKMGKKPKWYLQFYPKGAPRVIYKSLGMDYEETSLSRNAAEDKARQLYERLIKNHDKGIFATYVPSLERTIDDYLDDIRLKALENENLLAKGLEPAHYVERGRGGSYHTILKYETRAAIFKNYLIPFFQETTQRDGSNPRKPLYEIEIANIKPQTLDTFASWARNDNPTLSPSRISRIITEIRALWGYAYDKEEALFIPSPKQLPQNLRKRTRRKLKEEEYLVLLTYAKEKFEAFNKEPIFGSKQKERRDTAYQFYLWVNLISWCGIRPWSGSVDKNILRLDGIIIENKGESDEKRFIDRIDEKSHTYRAPIPREAWWVIDKIFEFHELNGNDIRKQNLTSYVFFHTTTKDGYKKGWSIGDPIKNFRKSWKEAVIATGLQDETMKTPQERLVPYSLRHYYLTARIRHGDVPLLQLANSGGTSVRMLEQTYFDFIASKEYERLTKMNKAIPEEFQALARVDY